MARAETILPPHVILTPESVYAIQGDIYALEPLGGAIQRHYPTDGSPKMALTHEMFYMNVTSSSAHTVQAMQIADGALLWRYVVDSPLAGTPAVGDGVLHVGIRDGSTLALRIADGSLLWHYKIPYLPMPPLSDPILVHSPVVANEIVYLSLNASPPMQSSLSALQVRTGQLLWQVPLPEPMTHEMIITDGTIYFSTPSMCCAYRACDGLQLWSRILKESGHLYSRLTVADKYVYVRSLQITPEYAYEEHAFMKYTQVHIRALRKDDGMLLWKTQVAATDTLDGSSVTGLVATQASIFVQSDQGALSALHRSDGTVRWRYQTSGTRLSVPVVSHDVLHVGVNDGSVLALHADDGILLWRTPLNGKKNSVSYTYRKR